MRKYRQQAQGLWCNYIALLFCLGCAIVFTYGLAELIEDSERIQEEGVLLEGTVTDKRIDGNRGVTYYIEIEFTYEGQALEEVERVSKSEYDFFQVDQTVQFHYLPDASMERVVLVGDSNFGMMVMLSCFASFMFIAFFYGLVNLKK